MDDVSLNFETDLPNDEKPSFFKQYNKSIILLLAFSLAIFFVVFVIFKNREKNEQSRLITPSPTLEVTIIPTLEAEASITPSIPSLDENQPVEDSRYTIRCDEKNAECYLYDNYLPDDSILVRKCGSENNLIKCTGNPVEFEPQILGSQQGYIYLILQTTEVCNCGIEGEIYKINISNNSLSYVAYATDSEILIQNPDLNSKPFVPENCTDVTKESTYTYECLSKINPEFYESMSESEAKKWIEENKENTINYYLYIHPFISD